MNRQIKRLVLTGGPCAGKTTALAYLQEKLADAGFLCLIVPEAATLLLGAGFKPGATLTMLDFERLVLKTITALENLWLESAGRSTAEKIVLLCDRGMMDAKAYIPTDQFAAVRQELAAHEVIWRDERYDAVFHLRTAALGAEAFYTFSNNSARSETPDQAVELDQRTLRAWTGHPHLRVLDNSTDFAGKLHRLRREVFAALGVPVPLEIERKFLVKPIRWENLPLTCTIVEIEQGYLLSGDQAEEVRVRRRGQNGAAVYYRTVKRRISPGVRVETERHIDEREYHFSLDFLKPGTRLIRKRRGCFLWQEQYFELDQFLDPPGFWILEVELTDSRDKVALPPFVEVIREVTDDPACHNAFLAQK